MSGIIIPIEQLIDGRTEPFELKESPYVSQYYLGYMRGGLGWATPTLLFIERWGVESIALFPDMKDGWVVRAEPAGPNGLNNSFYLNTCKGVYTFEKVWKYKCAQRFATLDNAIMWVNWALDILPDSYYRAQKLETILPELNVIN